MQHAARTVLLQEGLATRQPHVAGVVLVLRFLLGVEVIQIAEELVEAVHRRQVLVAVPLMVLAELARRVPLALQDGRHGDVGLLPAFLRARHPDLRHPVTDGHRAADEGRTASRAALLPVVSVKATPSLAMRSMLGVLNPIIPRLLWLMFQVPMSSPQMTRMFGLRAVVDAAFCANAADGYAHSASPATSASAQARMGADAVRRPPCLLIGMCRSPLDMCTSSRC
jgi:hypothetical protein